MSRRERDVRDARDSRGRRLHSKFDRESSPKKLRRDEKLEVDRPPSSQHHLIVAETSGHGQKRRSLQDGVALEVPPTSSTAGLLNDKKSLEGKGDRGGAGQGGRNYGRRTADHGRWSDSKVESRNLARDETYDPPKKDERSQSHADEKTGVWRHDRFYELESGLPPARKRPSFSEKKIIAEPEGDAATLMGSDKTKLPTCVPPPELATSKRDERGGFYPRALDKPDRTFSRADDGRGRRGDGFYQRGEIQRNVNQSRERYGGLRGRGDRFNMRYGERDLNHAGGFEAEKWKHDLFDEANKSPPPKNEEDHIAKVEALLAL